MAKVSCHSVNYVVNVMEIFIFHGIQWLTTICIYLPLQFTVDCVYYMHTFNIYMLIQNAFNDRSFYGHSVGANGGCVRNHSKIKYIMFTSRTVMQRISIYMYINMNSICLPILHSIDSNFAFNFNFILMFFFSFLNTLVMCASVCICITF